MQEPAKWTRETPWRQGHVLCSAACAALGLKDGAHPEATCVVVIGHDCDLANDNLDAEPSVEVIVGRLVNKANGNFTWGKAPRTLHLEMLRDGHSVAVELVATAKEEPPKGVLAQFVPDTAFELDATQLGVLRSWLGARYNRTAFPDTFVDRMKATKADTRLAKLIEPKGNLVSFVYFVLDDGEMRERDEGDPYELSIVLVHRPGDDPDDAADQADTLAEEIFAECKKRLPGTEHEPNQNIILKSCISISEDDVTVTKARLLAHWRLEYMSLRADEEQVGALEL